MRKLMIILLAFIAVVTFIRAFDNSAGIYSEDIHSSGASEISGSINNLETGQ